MKNGFSLTVVIFTIITLLCVLFTFSCKTPEKRNLEFLESYGWQVEKKPSEKVNIVIPDIFDDVYLNYNKLQEEASLDLTPYLGYEAVRYTYKVKNFPYKTDSEVFANVISVDGIPVAGDICTHALDGFMYSLNFNIQNCFSNDMMEKYF